MFKKMMIALIMICSLSGCAGAIVFLEQNAVPIAAVGATAAMVTSVESAAINAVVLEKDVQNALKEEGAK